MGSRGPPNPLAPPGESWGGRAPPRPNPPAGTEECEHAVIDFLAFQDISFKKLLRLQQALTGSGGQSPLTLREGRVALQLKLRQQLTELRKARAEPLLTRLLRALREARLPGLERNIRERFLRVR
ncbi:PREDICTED: tumor necrosis factor receptor superfamily member 6B [Ceratotherium simum simum]|uniref:Tumor necrosis factor receptor superfamily member 6B n=1 Tax=Ceratotherium simum simum TaxID=73337 RepID=A0ABM1CTZ4_CERSS|nr:PREDICTED: tumor necrosis factor receptor superfamily member 6B [Ceratotherium simum simum]